MFVLSYIGIATAFGYPIDVPTIIRSLADIMGLESDIERPIVFDPDFLATLDLDRRDKALKYEVVDHYEHMWWTSRKPRDLDYVNTLNASTVEACLKHYRDQRSKSPPCADPTANAESDNADPATAGPSHITPSPATADICPKCIKYRYLLSEVLQDILNIRNFSSAMSNSSENLLKIGLRKASTFYLLHEAAILKETADVNAPVPDTIAERIAIVNNDATSYLKQVHSLPASSYKWTWGKTLTVEEVLALRRTGTKPGRAPHSGYDVSLREGLLGGHTTDIPTNPTSHGHHEDIPADVSFIPPSTHLSMPHYFSRHDRLEYDPLHLSASSFTGSVGEIRSPPTSALCLVEQWKLSGMSEDEALQTGPAEMSGHEPAPAFSQQSLAQQLAGKWISSTEAENKNPTHVSAMRLAEQWRNMSRDEVLLPAPPAPPPAQSPPVFALHLAKQWRDTLPLAPTPSEHLPSSSALLLAKRWMNTNRESKDEDSDVNDSLPAPGQQSIGKPGPASALLLARLWKESSEGDAEDEESSEGSGEELSTSPTTGHSLANMWPSDSESSQHTSGSQ